MSAAADVIGVTTGVAGLIVGLVSLRLQIRADTQIKNQRSAPTDFPIYRGYQQFSPPMVSAYPAPLQASLPASRTLPASPLPWWLTSIYGTLGGANYVILALLVLSNSARQVVSGLIILVGAIAMLLHVRYRFREWTRPLGFAFGALGGALVLASHLIVDPTPPPSLQRQLIVWVAVVVVTVLVVIVDKYRASRG